MTRGTIGKGTLVNPVHVTCLAGDIDVFSSEVKVCQIMVKLCGFPAACAVTSLAISAEPPFMRLIIGVAIDALGGSILHVEQRSGIEVALRADQVLVEAGQGEFSYGVVEFCTDRFNPVMTSHAVCPVSQYMGRGEDRIQFTVAGRACYGIKGLIVTIVAIGAGCAWVSGERISQPLMGKIRYKCCQRGDRTMILCMASKTIHGRISFAQESM